MTRPEAMKLVPDGLHKQLVATLAKAYDLYWKHGSESLREALEKAELDALHSVIYPYAHIAEARKMALRMRGEL